VSIPRRARERVRVRANFACEYCGVTETDTGGELTVDHFQPTARGGSDHLSNLLYCCHRCNQYKADYWPHSPVASALWNPREETPDIHFLLLEDGKLSARTTVGEFTIRRLRLNRQPLIAHRQRKRNTEEAERLRLSLHELLISLEQLLQQHAALLDEQSELLREERALLRRLLGQQE
jgi:hypothetical protein